MKIAVLIRRLDSPGGAEQSMQTLSKHLSEQHDVEVFPLIKDDSTGSKSFSLPLPRQLKMFGGFMEGMGKRKELEGFEPDLILAQHELAYLGSWYSSKKDVPMIYFLRDYENLYDKRFYGRYKIDAAINHVFSYITERYTKKILDKSSGIIANSNYLGDRYEKHFNIETETVYPFVNPKDYRVKETGEKILHVNPTEEKGIVITLEVAEKMPEEEFIIAGTTKKDKIKQKMESLNNVEHLGYVEDMKEAYRQTKIALVPSKWEEPYGRIPVEAGASGIPTVATSNGGLPESVGNQKLLVDSEEPEEFVEKIKHLKEDYEKFSEHARENTEEKRQEKQLEKFEELMKDVKQ
jgi:glycosyltransferase involved in cell wall biosynthesis